MELENETANNSEFDVVKFASVEKSHESPNDNKIVYEYILVGFWKNDNNEVICYR